MVQQFHFGGTINIVYAISTRGMDELLRRAESILSTGALEISRRMRVQNACLSTMHSSSMRISGTY